MTNTFDKFNKIATDYDEAAVIAPHMGEQLLERLAQTGFQPRQILDVGTSTGLVTQKLQQQYPEAEITGIDNSEEMLAVAKTRCPQANLILGDIFKHQFSPQSFDLIFVNMVLPWITDVEKFFLALQPLLRPNGLLLASTLGPDTLKELRAAWEKVDDDEHVKKFIDMHDLGDCLRALKFEDVVLDRENVEITFSDVPSLLYTLKAVGGSVKGKAKFIGKDKWQQLFSYYPHNTDNTIIASAELIYIHLRAPKAEQEPGVSYVSLSQLKRKKD